MQGAFSGLQDVEARSDGAMFTGTPGFTPMWRELTDARDPGSLEYAPVLDDGRQVRWGDPVATGVADLWGPGPRWDEPRVLEVDDAWLVPARAGPPQVGDPGSRASVSSRHSGVNPGVPVNIAPSERASTSCTPLNAPCMPNDPSEMPKASRRGRASSGSSDQRAYTASKSALPAAGGVERSPTKLIQLGRYEYCMLAIAVSPPCMSSSASTLPGSTQPVPVVVATTRTDRSHASVRSSSSTTRAAVASRSPSGSRPA